MGLTLYGWLYIGKNLSPWILAPMGIMVGGFAYLAALWVLRVPELTYAANGVLRRLKR